MQNHQPHPTGPITHKTPVLIIGSGSAGLCAATWLARCRVPCTVLEKRDSPLQIGQADGVQCRTVEVFESFGIEDALLRESYHVLEVCFWDTKELSSIDGNTPKRGLVRTSRTADTAPGLSHQPHVILNQARVNGLMLEAMEKFNGQRVEYGYEIKDVQVDGDQAKDPEAYAVTVTTVKNGQEEIWKAKYALGCDGAHSVVRRSLGYKMVGDTSDVVWGVMDVYPRTDFPDIRKKATLHADTGNLLIIPREGGSLVRFYIQLPAGTVAKDVTRENLHDAAKKIFSRYTLDIAETFWWSAYSIGQRLADHFHKDYRVFLFGDACHTHSPKAGQGMNVSLQDGYNMGWKLASILRGMTGPELVETYVLERQKVAADLIDFDRSFAKMFSSKASTDDPESFAKQFIKSGRYTAGLTATYQDSMITSANRSKPDLAKNITVGMRFPSAQVVRLCDAKAQQFVRAMPADGRWRIVVFAGESGQQDTLSRLEKLGRHLESDSGPIRRVTSPDADIDSVIETLVVFHGDRIAFEQEQVPPYFQPLTGRWKMRDLHKVFFDDHHYNAGHGHAYETYGIDKAVGAMVIIRPDHYVSLVTDIDDHAVVGDFFGGFLHQPS